MLRVSAIVMRRAAFGGRVLMLRRATTLQGEWCQVAGKIEAGETAWQAAVREIEEETALVPTSLYSAEILEQFYEIDKDSFERAGRSRVGRNSRSGWDLDSSSDRSVPEASDSGG